MARSKMITRGAWQQAMAVKHALCSDGKRRYATVTGEADTFFSIPASVKVRGKRVSGFIMQRACYNCEERDSCGMAVSPHCGDMVFCANAYGKNGHLLP